MDKLKKRVPAALTAGILAVSLMSAGFSPLTSFALESGPVPESGPSEAALSREEESAMSSVGTGRAEDAGITEDSRASAGMDSAGAAAFASAGGACPRRPHPGRRSAAFRPRRRMPPRG